MASTATTMTAGPGGGGTMPNGMTPPSGMGGRGGGLFFLGGTTGIILMVVFVLTLIVLAIAFWQAYKKTGRTPALGLLMLVPVVNLGVAIHYAFAEWPVLKENKRLKLAQAMADEDNATGLG